MGVKNPPGLSCEVLLSSGHLNIIRVVHESKDIDISAVILTFSIKGTINILSYKYLKDHHSKAEDQTEHRYQNGIGPYIRCIRLPSLQKNQCKVYQSEHYQKQETGSLCQSDQRQQQSSGQQQRDNEHCRDQWRMGVFVNF